MSNVLRLSRTLITVTAALSLAACDATGPDVMGQLRSQLRTHEDVWADNGAASYSVRVELRCLCADPYEVTLQIVDGEIESGTHVFSGDALTPQELSEQLTLPDLFAIVEDALDRRVPGVSISYDPEVGFVRHLYVDYNGAATNDDVEYLVSEYTPVTIS